MEREDPCDRGIQRRLAAIMPRTSRGPVKRAHCRPGKPWAAEKTNKDKDDASIVLEWKPETGRTAKKQYGLVEIFLPVLTLEFGWTQDSKPGPAAKAIIGHTNSNSFQSDAAGYWLCTDFGFDSSDSGTNWQCSAKFGRHPNLWKQTIYYLADNGKPPPNWDAAYQDGKTVQEIEVYNQVNFVSTLDDVTLPNVMSA